MPEIKLIGEKRVNISLKKILILILIGFIMGQYVQAQKRNKKPDNKKTDSYECSVEYQDVLNYLFPIYFTGRGSGLILKYQPPGAPEMQINIFYPESAPPRLILYEAKNRSVLSQIEEIVLNNQKANFQEVVKQVRVTEKVINMSENEIRKFREDFLEVVNKSLEFEKKNLNQTKSKTTIFDESGYEALYFGRGTIRLRSEGNLINEKSSEYEPPLIEWMREVYKMVEKRANIQ